MSTATATTYTATTTDRIGSAVELGDSNTTSRRDSARTNVNTTTPKAPTHQPLASTSVVPTPPTSRPSTPSTPTGTQSSPPPSPTKPTVKPVAKSNWLNHLSHISIATWIGVGLALGGLVVTIYYGIPILRLAIWTAQNDFREACKTELDTGLQQSAACNRALAQPAQPPPIVKRAASDISSGVSKELAPWIVTTCFALLFALCNGLRDPNPQQGNPSDTFGPYQSLLNYMYFLVLELLGILTSLLALTSHSGIAISIQLAAIAVCFFASRSSRGREVATIWNGALGFCVYRLLLISVYAGLRCVWPSDTFIYNPLAWGTGTELCIWMFAVYALCTRSKTGDLCLILETLGL